MKAAQKSFGPVLAASLMLAACVPAGEAPAPAPAPSPIARPAPAPVPAAPPPVYQAPVSDNWMDSPATPGTWRYESSAGVLLAVFIGLQGRGDFVLSCDRSGGPIRFWRAGTSPTPRIMTIRTETATRSFQAVQAEDTNPYLTTSIAGNDPLLDAMALSKGRFAIEVDGQPPLYLPAWAEVSRVIEDCRE